MSKKKSAWSFDAAVRGSIRRAFARSPAVIEALNSGRKEITVYKKNGEPAARKGVRYQCQTCQGWFKRTEIQLDHIIPVIDPETGFDGWDKFVERIDVPASGLRRICLSCHRIKTNHERNLRLSIAANKDLDNLSQMSDDDALRLLKRLSKKDLAKYPEYKAVSNRAKEMLANLKSNKKKKER